MKLPTLWPFRDAAPVTAETLSANHRQIATGLTNIEYRQLPADVVGISKMDVLDVADFPTATATQETLKSSVGWWAVDTAAGAGDIVELDEVLPADWPGSGWQRLYDLSNDFSTSIINLPSNPGRLIGGVGIDSELRTSVSATYPTDSPYPNKDLYWEFAVYVNSVKVGQSPRLYAGRHSIYIPFMYFCGAEPLEIDTRVRVYFGQQQYKDATSRNREPFLLHSIQMWANSSRH